MEQAQFRTEDEKYSHLWANGYGSARWKLLARCVVGKAKRLSVHPSVIDFGTGRGDAVAYFDRKGFRSAGVDISRYAVDRLKERGYACHWASLDALTGIPDKAFEYGFSNDVLEHLPEPCLDGAFSEMARVCTRSLFLSICPVPSRNKSKEGDNLHLTVRPKEWWEGKLARIGAVREIRFFLNRSLRYEVELF